METEIFIQIFADGLFAAIAAIGFSAISNTPRRAYWVCGLLAAVGHAIRFLLTGCGGWNIISASSVAAVAIGCLAIVFAPRIKCPAEVCFFPALLPMIPGMYAYRTVEALVGCICHTQEPQFMHYLYLFSYNGLTCCLVLCGMVLGAVVPVFCFKHIAFRATR